MTVYHCPVCDNTHTSADPACPQKIKLSPLAEKWRQEALALAAKTPDALIDDEFFSEVDAKVREET
jgi:hypothetical protein